MNINIAYSKESALNKLLSSDLDVLIIQGSVKSGIDSNKYKTLLESYPEINKKEIAYRNNYKQVLYRPESLLGEFYIIIFDVEIENILMRKYLIVYYSTFNDKKTALNKEFDTIQNRKAWLSSCLEKSTEFLNKENKKREEMDKLNIGFVLSDFKYFQSKGTGKLQQFVDKYIGPKIYSFFSPYKLYFTIYKKS